MTPGLRRVVAQQVRDRIFDDLGVLVPPTRIAIKDDLSPRTIILMLFEVPARVFHFDKPMSEKTPDAGIVKEVGAGVLEVLAPRASDFLGLAATQRMLDELQQFAPATVTQVVPKPISLALLNSVLRRLLDEGVSIRDLATILETLSSNANEKEAYILADRCREALRRAITYRLTRGEPSLDVITMDLAIEDTIRKGAVRVPYMNLVIAPQATRDIIVALKRAIDAAARSPTAEAGRAPVLLTQPDIRPFVRRLLLAELPHVVVVTFSEIVPSTALRLVATATPGA